MMSVSPAAKPRGSYKVFKAVALMPPGGPSHMGQAKHVGSALEAIPVNRLIDLQQSAVQQ